MTHTQDPIHSYASSSYGSTGESRSTNTDSTKAVLDQARDMGEAAMESADEYLKVVGLSLKERPVATLAVVGGIGLAVGALLMSKRQSNSSMTEFIDTFNDFARKQRWY